MFTSERKTKKNRWVVSPTQPRTPKTPRGKGPKEGLLEVSSYETLEMHVETDASLLGGMVIRIGDEILDNSIRSKWNIWQERSIR